MTPTSISIRYVSQGDPSTVSDDFAPNKLVQVNRALSEGVYTIQVNGQPCGGAITMASDRTTEAVLTLRPEACSVVATITE